MPIIYKNGRSIHPMKLNRYQIRSLKRLYDRVRPTKENGLLNSSLIHPDISFREFRRGVYPMIGAKETACIRYANITYGIEPDGYCHT
jgi:hypothetical protein